MLHGHGPRRGQTPIGPLSGRHGPSLSSFPRASTGQLSAATTNTTPPGPSHHATLRVLEMASPGRERCGVKLGGSQLGHGAAAGLLHPLDPPKATHRSRFIKDPFPQSDGPTLPTALRVWVGFQLVQTLENILLRTPTSNPSTVDTDTQTRRRLRPHPPSPSPPPTAVPKHAPLLLMPPSPPPSPSHPSASHPCACSAAGKTRSGCQP